MTQHYKNLIVRERAEVMTKLGMKPEALADHGHVGDEDQAQLTHDEFVAIRVNYIEYKKLQQLDAALQRITEGAYGVCSNCEQKIPTRRLDAIPWAEFCVRCQEAMAYADGDADDRAILQSLAEVQ